MPWDTIGYNKASYSILMKKYALRGIPNLLVLKGDGSTKAENCDGRGDVTKAL